MNDDGRRKPKVKLPEDEIEPITEQQFAHLYKSPVERFSQLPKEVRKYLEQLRDDDVKDLVEAVKFYKTAKMVGKFNLWLVGGIVGLFIATVSLGETIQTALKWFRH